MKPIFELLIYKYFSFFVILLLRRIISLSSSSSSFVDDLNLEIIILLKRNGLMFYSFYSRDFIFKKIYLKIWFSFFILFLFLFFHL